MIKLFRFRTATHHRTAFDDVTLEINRVAVDFNFADTAREWTITFTRI